jgi:hypothetical protein
MEAGRRGQGWALAALGVMLALLIAAENPGAPQGTGRSWGGGFAPNSADPPGPIPGPRLPELLDDTPPTLDQLNRITPYDFDPDRGIHLEDFTLWTTDDLGRLDPAPQQYLRMELRNMEYGAQHLVVYTREAPGLYDLTFYVRYHQERLHPRQIEPGGAFGFEGDRLFIGKLDMPGIVGAAFTRIRPDRHGGTKLEDGVIAEIVFEERPFDFKPDPLTHAPAGDINEPGNIQVYIDNVRRDATERGLPSYDVVLYWEGPNTGDFNNDGEVMMTDIIPIGRRYGNLSTDGVEDDWDRMADGNRDGEVNYRDVWTVQEHYGSRLAGYRVYRRPAGRPQSEEVLLRHRTMPILPLSVHRPVRWNPIARYAYRYYDRDLPRTAVPTQWTYRIVPYDAASDSQGEDSSVEFTVSVTDREVELVGRSRERPTPAKPKATAKPLRNPARGRT